MFKWRNKLIFPLLMTLLAVFFPVQKVFANNDSTNVLVNLTQQYLQGINDCNYRKLLAITTGKVHKEIMWQLRPGQQTYNQAVSLCKYNKKDTVVELLFSFEETFSVSTGSLKVVMKTRGSFYHADGPVYSGVKFLFSKIGKVWKLASIDDREGWGLQNCRAAGILPMLFLHKDTKPPLSYDICSGITMGSVVIGSNNLFN